MMFMFPYGAFLQESWKLFNMSKDAKKKKATHPWRAWNPGAFKLDEAPKAYREYKHITSKNRAI